MGGAPAPTGAAPVIRSGAQGGLRWRWQRRAQSSTDPRGEKGRIAGPRRVRLPSVAFTHRPGRRRCQPLASRIFEAAPASKAMPLSASKVSSSPDRVISVMMSHPPTNSPFT